MAEEYHKFIAVLHNEVKGPEVSSIINVAKTEKKKNPKIHWK